MVRISDITNTASRIKARAKAGESREIIDIEIDTLRRMVERLADEARATAA